MREVRIDEEMLSGWLGLGVNSISLPPEPKESINVYDTLLLRLCALHRLQADWTFDDYSLTMQVYHGTRPIAEAVATEFVRKSESLYERVKFDTW